MIEDIYEYIEIKRKQPFEWGKNDCVLFVLGYLDNTLDLNEHAKHYGKYSSEEEAIKYLNTQGLSDTTDAADRFLKRCELKLAKRGDIIQFQKALGICLGRKSYFLMKTGLVNVDTLKCELAWRVD